MRRLGDVALVDSVVEAHVVLHAHGPRHAEPVARHAEHRQTVGVLVGETPVLDEPLVEEGLDGEHLPLEDFVAGHVWRQFVCCRKRPVGVVLGAWVEGGAAEDRRVAAREVQLVEVDVLALQPLDGCAARALQDVHLVTVVLLLLAFGITTNHGGVALGRHIDVLSRRRARRHALRQPVADPHLGQLAVVEGHRVELRRVNKVGAWAVKRSEFGDPVQAPARRRCSLSSACTAQGLSPLGPRG